MRALSVLSVIALLHMPYAATAADVTTEGAAPLATDSIVENAIPNKSTFSASCAPNDGAALSLHVTLEGDRLLILNAWGEHLAAIKTGGKLDIKNVLPDINNGLSLSYCPDEMACDIVSGTFDVLEYTPQKSLSGALQWTNGVGQSYIHNVKAIFNSSNEALCG